MPSFSNRIRIILISLIAVIIIFLLGSFLLLFKNSQKANAAGGPTACFNGPSNSNSGGCGTPCNCGSAWSQYDKQIGGSGDFCEIVKGITYHIVRVKDVCMTGDKCISGEKGLRYGTCDCGYGGIYKTCCSGSTPVNCNRYSVQDGIGLDEGTCSPNSMVYGTSCTSSTPGDPGGGNGGTCLVAAYNNACPSGYVLSRGCCYCP
jgi:hypothetical protein